MFNIASKYFKIFKNKSPANWVAHITRDFLTCYCCSYFNSMILHRESFHRKNIQKIHSTFLITCLIVPRPTLGYYTGRVTDSPTRCQSLSFILFNPKVTRSLVMSLGLKAWPSTSIGFEAGTFWSIVEALTHCAYSNFGKQIEI